MEVSKRHSKMNFQAAYRVKIIISLLTVFLIMLNGFGVISLYTISETTGETEECELSSSINENSYEPSNAKPRQAQALVESVPSPTTLTAFVGQQDVEFQVTLQSLSIDDDDDTNGDNVLYDLVLDGTDAGILPDNLMKYNKKTQQFVNVTSPVFKWNVKQVFINTNDKNDSYLYTAGNFGPYKYVINQSNSFLDENNNGNLDTGEYWAIYNGPKSFGNFKIDINPNIKPGNYRMKFKVTYRYQISNNINISGVGNHTSSIMANTNLWINEALGPFQYYYWVPWNTAANSLPTDLDDLWQNNTADFDFHKQVPYAHSTEPYNNVWEGLRDNGVDRPGNHPDLNGDSETRWLPSYPFTAGHPGYDIDAIFNSTIISNYPINGPIIQQRSLDQIKNVNRGNGTWIYTGNVTEDIDWGDPATHTEDVWFDFIIYSSITPENDLNGDSEPNDLKLSAVDGNAYAGENFEDFIIKIGNQDPILKMWNITARLITPSNMVNSGFIFYNNQDITKLEQISSLTKKSLIFNLSIDFDTPPGTYFGQLEVYYLKNFPTRELDPLGNPLTVVVNVTENHWIVRFKVDPPPDPEIPKDLVVNPIEKGNTLNISWKPTETLTMDYILWSNSSGPWEVLTEIRHPKNYFIHTNLTDGVEYYYKLEAINSLENSSGFTNIVSGVPYDSVPPNPPLNLTVTTVSDNTTLLNWTPPKDLDLSGFDIYRKETEKGWYEKIHEFRVSNNSYQDTKLFPNTTYWYKINAYDEVPNYSKFSNEAFNKTESINIQILLFAPTGNDVRRNTEIIFDFNQPMNPQSVEEAFDIQPKVNGTLQLLPSSNNTFFIFFPDSELASKTRYFVSISNSAQNLYGEKLKSRFSWNFTTAELSYGENTPPDILSYSPTGDNVPINSTFTIVFDKLIDRLSIINSIKISNNVKINITLQNNKLIGEPFNNLDYNTKYVVTLDKNISDEWGNKYNKTFIWEFTTEEQLKKPESDDEGDDLLIISLIIIIIIMIIIIMFILMRSKTEEY